MTSVYSEWNKYAQKTYLANFGEMPFGDITKDVTKSYIPKECKVLSIELPDKFIQSWSEYYYEVHKSGCFCCGSTGIETGISGLCE